MQEAGLLPTSVGISRHFLHTHQVGRCGAGGPGGGASPDAEICRTSNRRLGSLVRQI